MEYDEIEMKSGEATKVAKDSIVEAVPPGTDGYRKKPRLDRYLGFLSMLAFSSTLQASWESMGASLFAGLLNGGPVSLIYGLILTFFGSLALSSSLGEMASILPVAGAQYHWTYNYAPRAPNFLSMMQGWITVFAWWANVAISPYLVGTQIQGLLILNYDSYVPHRWHGTLLVWAVLLVPLIVNIWARRLLASVEIFGGIIHIIFFPAALVTLVVLAPRNTSSFVWTKFVNDFSGWTNDGVIWSVGLLTATFTLSSFDGVLHMSEEVKNAKKTIPQSMVFGIIINGIITFGFLIGLLYCMGDLDDALETPTGYPIIEIFYQATKSKSGTTGLMVLIIMPGFISLFNVLASVTRLTWAFARDDGLPFSDFFVQVSPRFKIPIRALFLVSSITVLLSLINIGSTAAFNAILSLSTLGLYISYLIPISFLVLKRFNAPEQIKWGPFYLGKWGLPINLFAICYGIYICIFLPFPPEQPVTWQNMNYAGPVFGFVLIFAVVDWFLRGHKKWNGPTIKVAED